MGSVNGRSAYALLCARVMGILSEKFGTYMLGDCSLCGSRAHDIDLAHSQPLSSVLEYAWDHSISMRHGPASRSLGRVASRWDCVRR
eukprot:scaffold4719_cov314-Pinguiococcus_pyrenoidosus.AAC.7